MKRLEAIALCRVSTKKQLDDGNLEPQERRIMAAAEYLEADIVKWWKLAISSRKGKNAKRKDLQEMLAFCKKRRTVKYLIVDEPDRFMRSITEYYWWKMEFQQIGVELRSANRPEMDPNDDRGVFDELIDVYRAEQSNTERIHKTPEKQMSKMRAGYYPFSPLPGYKKSNIPSLHDVDAVRFYMLQEAFRSIADHTKTIDEAFRELTAKGYKTVNGKPIDMNRFKQLAIRPYYAGIIQIADWPVASENGLHTHMITKEEHETLKEVVAGKKKRFTVHRKNDDFPMNEMLCYDCYLKQTKQGKLTGYRNHNGKVQDESKRTYYYRYRCRGCNNYFKRDELHGLVGKKLSRLKLEDPKELIGSLQTIWKQEVRDNTNKLSAVERKLVALEESQSNLAIGLATATNADIRDATELAIQRTAADIRVTLAEKLELTGDEDLHEFIRFAVDYTEHIKDNYWQLNWRDRKRCEQLLFPAGFFATREKKVYTPEISPVYGYAGNQKTPVGALGYKYGGPTGT